MRTTSKPQEKATYVAPQSDKDWLLNVQRKLYTQSRNNLDYRFEKLWGFITDPQCLRIALHRVVRNLGGRTAGVDGITARTVAADGEAFIAQLRAELKSGAYRPSPVRRVLIPKAGQPGKHRALGIPTVKDRVVQAALKNILEPIFEADFSPVSYGFRPSKSAHGAIEHLRMLLTSPAVRQGRKETLPYQWAIEGDIKGCFDHISHHAVMEQIRRRVTDSKVNRLIVAFLKAGVLSEEHFIRTREGTPQGGILSPLLANIALSVIEERYERYVWPRRTPTVETDPAVIATRAMNNRRSDKRRRIVFAPIRYADDFIILVSAPDGPEQDERARQAALDEKAALATFLKERLGVELSESKTLVTSVTERLRFLGHYIGVRPHKADQRPAVSIVIPKEASQRLRERVKDIFCLQTTKSSLADRLKLLNPTLRGWANFYRHAHDVARVFARHDWYVWKTIERWLRKKHRHARMRDLVKQYGRPTPGRKSFEWGEGEISRFRMATVRAENYRLAWQDPPAFAQSIYGEPSAN
jgi:group II intron reverse transcriptase/maturase